jgi:hypothetical protein
MNGLFISQNITAGKIVPDRKVVKSFLHYYGPCPDLNRTVSQKKVLLGISFDSPINYDDQKRFCHLTFTFNYARGSSSKPILDSTSVDLDITL